MTIRVATDVARALVGRTITTAPTIARAIVRRRWKAGEPVFAADTKQNRRGKRITEREIADAVLAILEAKPNGRATIADIVHELPERVTLSTADFVRSPSRPNEALWQQQVRNIRSHKAFAEYGFKAIEGGFALKR